MASVVGSPVQDLLSLRSSQTTISSFLGRFSTLSVPQFQRDYAWGANAVALFLQDVDRCRRRRLKTTPLPHFFGAVVTSPADISGTSRPHQIVIDGQQRLATTFMLITALRRRYQQAANDTRAAGDDGDFAGFFKARAKNIIRAFERTSDIEFKSQKSIRKLLLNKVDDPYFELLLTGHYRVASRESHRRLDHANSEIETYLGDLLERADDNSDTQRVLDSLYSVFLKDLVIVHLSAGSNRQANRIYRVLNSRGVPVSNCDLLRAATLEFSEPKLDSGEIDSMIDAWDQILSGSGMTPDDALAAAFFSRTGIQRAKDQSIDQIEEEMFPKLLSDEKPTADDARKVLRTVGQLRDDILGVSKIAQGELCQDDHRLFTPVFKSRFEALTVVLRQNYCLPLLHAAIVLEPDVYAKLTDLVERFAFRYGVIVKAPMHPLMSVFRRHIRILRENSADFRVGDLRRDLSGLISGFAGDGLFRERLDSLEYGRENNKPLRYALVMIEHMHRWYDNNPQGTPVCRNTTRVIDFNTITLEHIEPTNAENLDPELRPYVNSIGNLTLLSPDENNAVRNKPFDQKRDAFADSDLVMNRSLAVNDAWTFQSLMERQKDLLDRLLLIFRI